MTPITPPPFASSGTPAHRRSVQHPGLIHGHLLLVWQFALRFELFCTSPSSTPGALASGALAPRAPASGLCLGSRSSPRPVRGLFDPSGRVSDREGVCCVIKRIAQLATPYASCSWLVGIVVKTVNNKMWKISLIKNENNTKTWNENVCWGNFGKILLNKIHYSVFLKQWGGGAMVSKTNCKIIYCLWEARTFAH